MLERDEVDELLVNLIRGLVQQNPRQICGRYRALVEIGPAALPKLRAKLLAYSWNQADQNKIGILTGLLSLAADIDESAARQIAGEIRELDCAAGCVACAGYCDAGWIPTFELNEVHAKLGALLGVCPTHARSPLRHPV